MNKKQTWQRLLAGCGAFTLIELLVVMAIIVILATITVPAIKSLTKNNASAQAINMIRAELAAARGVAISHSCHAGVVFFEETPANIQPANTNQTAMQIVVEVPGQMDITYYDTTIDKTASKVAGNTVFVYYTKQRQYLPSGIQVATLNDDLSIVAKTGQTASLLANSRVIMFDQNGQMVLMNNIASPDYTTGTADGGYPVAYGDWKFLLAGTAGTPTANVTSSPGIFVYNQNDFNTYVASSSPNDFQRSSWLEQHADVVVINAYTGGVIR